MGDRAGFAIEQNYGTETIHLYGHWAGDGMMSNLANALTAALPRIEMRDEAYSARIIISNLIGDEWRAEAGWGIATSFMDSEHSVPVVNLTDKTVRLIEHRVGGAFDINTKPKFVMSIDAFIKKFAKTLTTV